MAIFRKRSSINFKLEKVPGETYVTEMTDPSHGNYIWRGTSDAEYASDQQTT
jgi:hypothetical protein